MGWSRGEEQVSLGVFNCCLSQIFLPFFLLNSKNTSGFACIMPYVSNYVYDTGIFCVCVLVAALTPALAKAQVLLVLNCTTSLQAELFLSYTAGTFDSHFVHYNCQLNIIAWCFCSELQWSVFTDTLMFYLLFMSHYSYSYFHVYLLFFP